MSIAVRIRTFLFVSLFIAFSSLVVLRCVSRFRVCGQCACHYCRGAPRPRQQPGDVTVTVTRKSQLRMRADPRVYWYVCARAHLLFTMYSSTTISTGEGLIPLRLKTSRQQRPDHGVNRKVDVNERNSANIPTFKVDL